MTQPLKSRFTLNDLRSARSLGRKIPMLTCYDYTTARLMHAAAVPSLLVGDSAANVILGHDTTLPISLDFLIELTAAVRRGAPLALLVGDMPFGSYQGDPGLGCENVFKMVKQSGCDCVKLEVTPEHAPLVKRLADAGVAVMAHLGLRPQSVNVLGGYRFQGRSVGEAQHIIQAAQRMTDNGASALLLEAVPNEVSAAVVARTNLPVIGCGAGPACDGHVVVLHDIAGLTPHQPRFAPPIGDLTSAWQKVLQKYVQDIDSGQYPLPQHCYEMPPDQAKILAGLQQ